MSKNENVHSLILRKEVLHPVTFSSSAVFLPELCFHPRAPLLACVLRLRGFERNEWVIGTGTFAVCGYGFVQLHVGIAACCK